MTEKVSREVVESLISFMRHNKAWEGLQDIDVAAYQEGINTLRALLAERDALLAERDRLREAITWASVITSHGMGLSTSEERTLHSVLTSALKGDQA